MWTKCPICKKAESTTLNHLSCLPSRLSLFPFFSISGCLVAAGLKGNSKFRDHLEKQENATWTLKERVDRRGRREYSCFLIFKTKQKVRACGLWLTTSLLKRTVFLHHRKTSLCCLLSMISISCYLVHQRLTLHRCIQCTLWRWAAGKSLDAKIRYS